MEGQGRGIIMGLTRLLSLGPFYYIAGGYRIMNNTVRPRSQYIKELQKVGKKYTNCRL